MESLIDLNVTLVNDTPLVLSSVAEKYGEKLVMNIAVYVQWLKRQLRENLGACLVSRVSKLKTYTDLARVLSLYGNNGHCVWLYHQFCQPILVFTRLDNIFTSAFNYFRLKTLQMVSSYGPRRVL